VNGSPDPKALRLGLWLLAVAFWLGTAVGYLWARL